MRVRDEKLKQVFSFDLLLRTRIQLIQLINPTANRARGGACKTWKEAVTETAPNLNLSQNRINF